MKVTLTHNYAWDRVKVEPNEQTYNSEFVVDLPYKDVMEILRVQVEMEALQQRLQPLFEAGNQRVKEAADAAKLAELEAEGEELPTTV